MASTAVNIDTSTPTNYVDPGTRYVFEPDLVAPGQLSQQTLGERGFDVDVTRTVTADDGTIVRKDTFHSHYVPEDIVFDVGKKAKLPKGATLERAPVPSNT